MKKCLFRFLTHLLCLAVSSGLYLLSSYGLTKLFAYWNLKDATVPYAPSWAVWIYTNAKGLANLAFLLPACVLISFRQPSAAYKAKKKHLWYAPAGAASAAFLISCLLISGSIRYPAARISYTPAAAAGYLFTVLAETFLSAVLLRKETAAVSSKPVRYALSSLGQAALFLISGRGFHITSLVNCAFLGVFCLWLYEKHETLIPELLFIALFRFTGAVLFGYPDLGGAYCVSEPWLTGSRYGLTGAGITLIAFVILSAAYILLRIRYTRKENGLCQKRKCFSLPICRRGRKS